MEMSETPKKVHRLAIVVSELRPGGMERVVVHLSRGLCRRNIETLVVCIENPGVLASELEKSVVKLSALRSKRSRDVMALWRLRRIFKEFSPDIINVHDYASAPYAVSAKGFIESIPVVFTGHGLLYDGIAEKLRRRYRFFSKWFAALSAVSEKVAERHKTFLNWSGPVTVIPNGVPAIEREDRLGKKVRRELGCGEADTVFLAVGNPRPEKGFEDLIDAVGRLRDDAGPDKRFVAAIAGKMTDDHYCRSLLAQVRDRGLEGCCRFLGFRSDTAALYSAADVFVLSSRSEGLPMVILEAMMAGLPVVATRVGGVPDAVGENGILVEAGQPELLSKAMGRMMSDAGLRARLGRSGQAEAAKKYGVDRMVDDYIACYQRVLRERSTS